MNKNTFVIIKPDEHGFIPLKYSYGLKLIKDIIPQGLRPEEYINDILKLPPGLRSDSVFKIIPEIGLEIKSKATDASGVDNAELHFIYGNNPNNDELSRFVITSVERQGLGIAKPIMRALAQKSIELGRPSIRVAAGNEIGGAVWLIYGFKMHKNCWENSDFKKRQHAKINYYESSIIETYGKNEGAEIVGAMRTLLDHGEAESAWTLVQLAIPVKPFGGHEIFSTGFYDRTKIKTNENGMANLGVVLFAGEQWEGSLELSPQSQSYQIFSEQVKDSERVLKLYAEQSKEAKTPK